MGQPVAHKGKEILQGGKTDSQPVAASLPNQIYSPEEEKERQQENPPITGQFCNKVPVVPAESRQIADTCQNGRKSGNERIFAQQMFRLLSLA